MILPTLCALPVAAADWLPATCNAEQTVGIHQRTGDAGETHLPTVFSEQTFDLRENVVFMRHLLGERAETETAEGNEAARPPGSVQLYVTMILDGGAEAEFECRTVRGAAGNQGYSCVNNPPSEMLLINPERGRYTRSSIGGWVFYAPEASLFVEFGTCEKGAFSRGARGGTPRMKGAFSPGSARVSLARKSARGGTPRRKGAFSPGSARVSLARKSARGDTPRKKQVPPGSVSDPGY